MDKYIPPKPWILLILLGMIYQPKHNCEKLVGIYLVCFSRILSATDHEKHPQKSITKYNSHIPFQCKPSFNRRVQSPDSYLKWIWWFIWGEFPKQPKEPLKPWSHMGRDNLKLDKWIDIEAHIFSTFWRFNTEKTHTHYVWKPQGFK